MPRSSLSLQLPLGRSMTRVVSNCAKTHSWFVLSTKRHFVFTNVHNISHNVYDISVSGVVRFWNRERTIFGELQMRSEKGGGWIMLGCASSMLSQSSFDYAICKTIFPKFFPSDNNRYASGARSIGSTWPMTGCKWPCEIQTESCFHASRINSCFADR
jgi:hypothetical protein